jgi:hypothetical protein
MMEASDVGEALTASERTKALDSEGGFMPALRRI